MQQQVTCECGYVARDDAEGRLVSEVLSHVKVDHPELVDHVTADVVREWIEIVP